MAKRSKPALKEILEYFEENGYPKEPFKINQATTILDCEKCVASLTRILKANSGKKFAYPYYWTLVNIYEYLKNEK